MDYPLNEERGIPLKVVMEGYRSAQKKAKKLYGVEIVYIAGLDRTLSSERCLSFVKALRPYLDMVAGLGMDLSLIHIFPVPCYSGGIYEGVQTGKAQEAGPDFAL